jgi:hypothetical protein
MYKNAKANVHIVVASLLLLSVGAVPRPQPDHRGRQPVR